MTQTLQPVGWNYIWVCSVHGPIGDLNPCPDCMRTENPVGVLSKIKMAEIICGEEV